MPHLRQRFALEQLRRKLKFSRIVSIQGARQTGKSVLARDLFKQGYYVTFDRLSERSEAENRIGIYLHELQENAGSKTVVIDEAQKVPVLFDQVKALVDEDSKPGQFLLLGSTEFSTEAKIKESLTGRLSRTRLFPLLLSETLSNIEQKSIQEVLNEKKAKIERRDFLKFLKYGGFPGIFAIRDENERMARIEEWLKLTCERDVLQVKGLKPNPDLCLRILDTLPHLEEPTANALGGKLKKSTRAIETQIKALLQIFAIHKLDPHPVSSGKSLYFLIDPSLAHYLKAPFEAQMDIAIYTEFLAKQSYQNISGLRYSYYRSTRGGRISLLAELNPKEVLAIKWIGSEMVDHRELAIFESFKKKMVRNDIKIQTLLACGVSRPSKIEQVKIVPWEFLF